MGAQAAVDAGDLRWLKPFPLWAGILAGPIAWAFDLTTSYAIVKWVCHTNSNGVLSLITVASLAIVAGGAAVSWTALAASAATSATRTVGSLPTDGGRPVQRARFMAVLGLAACGLFALQILAGAIPHWVLDACQ